MIHEENPFVDDIASRDPARRFRGRLANPVTIVTSGDDKASTGLTVSSLVVIDGDPAVVELVVGPLTDLWEAVKRTGTFVVHICEYARHDLADVFAGLRPSPGGPFAAVATSGSTHGPLLDEIADRVFCTLLAMREVGHSGVITGRVDAVEISQLTDPLIHFRGRYHHIS